MNERDDIMRNVKQLIELDRAAGMEFVWKDSSTTVPAAASLPSPSAPLSTPLKKTAASTALVPPRPAASADSLTQIATQIAACRACGLCDGRKTTVPGEGSERAELLFVGDGPDEQDDASGRPFVGAAGELLTKMIEAMGLKRDQVFITNVVKCRLPDQRSPTLSEVTACQGFLHRQIALLKPKIVCAFGNAPLRALMKDETLDINTMRGKKLTFNGMTLIPTYHPRYLQSNPAAKKPCWEDLQLVLKELGRELPKRGG
jgi:uracil-DNA glycosylase